MDAIASSSLHPTAASIDDHHHQGRPPLPWPLLAAATVNNDCHCRRQRQTMTAGFWRSSSLTVWQWQWWLLTSAIAVVINGGSSGIELMAPIAALPTVAAVDGGSNDGVFTTASHDDDRHPCPHCPCPCPPLDKDQTAQWRVHCDASHLLLPCSLLLAPSLSPLVGRRHQEQRPK
jgi:hypothetical protein